MIGKIHSIETFGTVDGPGIRYVIFTQGCPMRCAYCHNPDTWDYNQGTDMTLQDILDDIKRYTRYIKGITVSGGEPLLQIDFLLKLFESVKQIGLTTCIDTSGIIFSDENELLKAKLEGLLKVTDLILLDVKHIDNHKHIKLTGHSNENVLNFARFVEKNNVDLWLRYVLVPGINDDEETLRKWKEFSNTLTNVKKIEVLPYHKLGMEKYKKLGQKYPLEGVCEPTSEQILFAREMLEIKEKE